MELPDLNPPAESNTFSVIHARSQNRCTPVSSEPRYSEASYWIDSSAVIDLGYLRDHRVGGQIIYPAAGYSMAGVAVYQLLPRIQTTQYPLRLHDLRFRKALPLTKHHTIALQLCYESSQREFTVFSRQPAESGVNVLHAAGRIAQPGASLSANETGLDEIQSRCGEPINVANFYERLRDSGLDYGEFFQRISSIHVNHSENSVLTQLCMHPGLAKTRDRWAQRITLLDAAFQSLGASLPTDIPGLYIPSRIKKLSVLDDFESDLWCYARLTKFSSRAVTGDITLFDIEGNRLVEIEGLRCLKMSVSQNEKGIKFK